MIVRFNFKTPGREDEEAVAQVSATDRAKTIVEGLGNKDNIEVVDCCATRLRVTLKNNDDVNKELLKSTGAKGVIQKGNGVQVVYGPHVTSIKNEIEEYLGI